MTLNLTVREGLHQGLSVMVQKGRISDGLVDKNRRYLDKC